MKIKVDCGRAVQYIPEIGRGIRFKNRHSERADFANYECSSWVKNYYLDYLDCCGVDVLQKLPNSKVFVIYGYTLNCDIDSVNEKLNSIKKFLNKNGCLAELAILLDPSQENHIPFFLCKVIRIEVYGLSDDLLITDNINDKSYIINMNNLKDVI